MLENSLVPIIDIRPLLTKVGDRAKVANELKNACCHTGFFYITGHGVDPMLEKELEKVSRQFFSLPAEAKMAMKMAHGGKAWRGFFPVGGELTSGKPDLKEGIYFGTELPTTDERVKAGWPLHGANLFPEDLPRFRSVVLKYMAVMTQLGHRLMEGLSLSLGLPATYFNQHYTSDPLTLFRIFHYPSPLDNPSLDAPWGVGEHTDYGVLTILKQDDTGGLQVKSKSGWIDAPYIPETFVCNIGDMLDRMTRGYYRSTPHRVKNTSHRGRLSYPFFFDPNFTARVSPLDIPNIESAPENRDERWDKASVHDFEGTYGDYILDKVSKVFPELKRQNL